MFGFLRRRKKKSEKKITSVPDSKTSFQRKYTNPIFGTPEVFMKKYMTGEQHLAIGKHDGSLITLTANSAPTNDIIVVNNNWESVVRQCIVPTIAQRQLSYVVYDPDGECYNRIGPNMKARGYDVQLVDLESEDNISRIDMFEVANITKMPNSIALTLTNAIGCDPTEAPAAHGLLMAIMMYLLETNKKLDIESIAELFGKVRGRDRDTLLSLKMCKESEPYLDTFIGSESGLRKSAMNKIENGFLIPATPKLSNPNIMAITAHKKKTIIFVKRVPKEYRYLVTMLMFNLAATSVMYEGQGVTTLIIDSACDEWYNRAFFKKICDDAGFSENKKLAYMRIRGSLDNKKVFDGTKRQIIIYMNSNSNKTKEYIHDCLLVRNQLSEKEKAELSVAKYDGKPIPDKVLNSEGILMEELGEFTDCIVIDTSGEARPFRCDRLT